MKITVLGGSGLIGSKLVNLLQQRGHEVVAASLASGVNTLTGEGLDGALAGAQVVVDVTNSPSFEDKAVLEFFETSGRNIFEAEVEAGVKHHVALSVVGADRLPDSGYLRAKVAQEKLIMHSLIPYTILRSTQFFEFLAGIAKSATDGQIVRLSPALVQPIASDDTVATLADVVMSPPLDGTIEVGGPERIGLAAIVERYLLKMGDPRRVIADVDARYFGARLNNHSLIAGADARIGSKSFEEWFSLSQPQPQMGKAGA
jgi:uncharacterized protein YbjT (DUF2867 family)